VAGLKLHFSQAIPAERHLKPLGNDTQFCTASIGYLQTYLSPAKGPASDKDLAIWLTLSRWLPAFLQWTWWTPYPTTRCPVLLGKDAQCHYSMFVLFSILYWCAKAFCCNIKPREYLLP